MKNKFETLGSQSELTELVLSQKWRAFKQNLVS